ncbi:hypothetical protein WN51_14150 [Melipona quadrifasciata]|uniref:Uncharacterized protein n=1 Tax=Melipona quadrifasciata TaxID=166423 RepID=A0A0M8ZZ51_9HYME|nr:hypothetical protein WN51_14150 [Melipona quadrifasciata]
MDFYENLLREDSSYYHRIRLRIRMKRVKDKRGNGSGGGEKRRRSKESLISFLFLTEEGDVGEERQDESVETSSYLAGAKRQMFISVGGKMNRRIMTQESRIFINPTKKFDHSQRAISDRCSGSEQDTLGSWNTLTCGEVPDALARAYLWVLHLTLRGRSGREKEHCVNNEQVQLREISSTREVCVALDRRLAGEKHCTNDFLKFRNVRHPSDDIIEKTVRPLTNIIEKSICKTSLCVHGTSPNQGGISSRRDINITSSMYLDKKTN